MRFNLRTLMQWMFIMSLYLALAYGVPPILSGPLLLLITTLLPVAIVCGIVYGQRSIRAFWIGCASGGFVPLLFGLYYAFALAVSLPWQEGLMEFESGAVRALAYGHGLVYVSGGCAVLFRLAILRAVEEAGETGDADSEPAGDPTPTT